LFEQADGGRDAGKHLFIGQFKRIDNLQVSGNTLQAGVLDLFSEGSHIKEPAAVRPAPVGVALKIRRRLGHNV